MQEVSTFEGLALLSQVWQILALIKIYWSVLPDPFALEKRARRMRARPPPDWHITFIKRERRDLRKARRRTLSTFFKRRSRDAIAVALDIAICGGASNMMPPYIRRKLSYFSQAQRAFLGLETTFQAVIICGIRSTDSRLLDSSLV
jgi:hypothetical protein